MAIRFQSDGMSIEFPVVMCALGFNVSVVGVDGKTKQVAITTPSGPQPGCPASVVDATSASHIQPQPQRNAALQEARRQKNDVRTKPKQRTTSTKTRKGGFSRPQQHTHRQHGDFSDRSLPQPLPLLHPPVNTTKAPTRQGRRAHGETCHPTHQAAPGSLPRSLPPPARNARGTVTAPAGGRAPVPTGLRSKPHPHLARKPLPLWMLNKEGVVLTAGGQSPSSPSSIQSEIYKRKRSRGKKGDRELTHSGRVWGATDQVIEWLQRLVDVPIDVAIEVCILSINVNVNEFLDSNACDIKFTSVCLSLVNAWVVRADQTRTVERGSHNG